MAIKYIHQNRIVHRDMKLGNLFLTDKMEVKVGDFGLAAKIEFNGERKRTVCGTPNYIAPEVIDGKAGHSFEVDIWSFGVIMFAMLFGRPPFETSDVKQTYKRIKSKDYEFPSTVAVCPQAKDLIEKILVLEPADRPTIDDILDHSFFHMGNRIPKLLPSSMLACPPTKTFISQFQTKLVPTLHELLTPRSRVELKHTRSEAQLPMILSKIKMSDDPLQSETRVPLTRLLIQPKNLGGPCTRVVKWSDYSNKYGLGYTLSNKATGVHFNDDTKMVLMPSRQILYLERTGADQTDEVATYTFTKYPSAI